MRTAHLIPTLAILAACNVQAADWLYLTNPGDTLSGIGQTYLRNPKDWPKVQSANGVAIPKHLPANSRLKIPVELLKVTPAPVSVIAVHGNVRYKRGDGPFQPLKNGETLNGGETVLTSLNSSVSYRFADNTRLTQQASSKLGFGRLASYGKTGMVSTEISLDSGRLEASAAKQLAPAGGFQVHTPVAVAGLRGTGFRLNLGEDGKTLRNEVTEGAVAVSGQGQEVKVDAGYGTYAELGKPPITPVSLLPKPDLSGLPEQFMRLPLSLNWPAQASARAWRVQLSGDAEFHSVLRDDIVPQPAAQWDADLPDGNYLIRVRAIDQYGLEGFDAQHGFRLNAPPLPPMPLKPALGERLGQPEVELAWRGAESAQGYLLQLAPTPEFGQGLIELRLPISETTHETLSAGDWHWRIASLDAQGQPRAFSPHRAFAVHTAPPLPAAPQVREEGGLLIVNWTGTAPAYRLEISRDEQFSMLLASHIVDATETRLFKNVTGRYWLRVIELNAQNQASAPGPATSIDIQYAYQPWWLLPLRMP
jgi:hypothetical protein